MTFCSLRDHFWNGVRRIQLYLHVRQLKTSSTTLATEKQLFHASKDKT
uniref:Uncharacterized protein n=1 Tax=Anopheles quadriannulatus TaxID=34691 RepID=A0A182X2H9_ANOQN